MIVGGLARGSARTKVAFTTTPGLLNVRLCASHSRRGLGVAACRQRSSQFLEAGVGPRGAIVQRAAQVIGRAAVQAASGDRSIELRHRPVAFSHPANAFLDTARGEEPLCLSQANVR